MSSPVFPAPILTSFPDTLQVATSAEGHALARRLASSLLSDHGAPATATMADMLRRQPAFEASELITAVYFHAIALANRGWVR